MSSPLLLDPIGEDALHAPRLLTVEERQFKRIAKRLLNPDALISAPPPLPPTPPPDATNADDEAAAYEASTRQREERIKSWRDDAILDFAAFESNIIRHQFLFDSNEKERRRYAAEKDKILETAQAVKDNTTDLRWQLEEAQSMLTLRKAYDEQAEKITGNKMLRPRADQHIQLEKLHGEIAELERESAEYAQTWAERRQQFGRIVEEGMQMLRLIRDEKEEAERKEGMEHTGDADEMELTASKNNASAVGSPGASTGAATPLHAGQQNYSDEGTPFSKISVSKVQISPGTPRSSRAPSPTIQATRMARDTPMRGSQPPDIGEAAAENELNLEIEEGEAEEDSETTTDHMDTT